MISLHFSEQCLQVERFAIRNVSFWCFRHAEVQTLTLIFPYLHGRTATTQAPPAQVQLRCSHILIVLHVLFVLEV